MCTHCIATEWNLLKIFHSSYVDTSAENLFNLGKAFTGHTLIKPPWENSRVLWKVVKDNFFLRHLLHPRIRRQVNLKAKKMWSLWKHLTKSLFGRHEQTWSLTPFFCPHRLLCHKQAHSQVVSQATIESSVFYIIPTSVENQSADLPGAGFTRNHFCVNFKKNLLSNFSSTAKYQCSPKPWYLNPLGFAVFHHFLACLCSPQLKSQHSTQENNLVGVYCLTSPRPGVCQPAEPLAPQSPHLQNSLLPKMSANHFTQHNISRTQKTSISWSKVSLIMMPSLIVF